MLKGGGMSERGVSGNPQEKTSLCGGRAVQQPASSWGSRVGFHLRVGGEGRLLPAMSKESHRVEEASPSPGRPKLIEGWFDTFSHFLWPISCLNSNCFEIIYIFQVRNTVVAWFALLLLISCQMWESQIRLKDFTWAWNSYCFTQSSDRGFSFGSSSNISIALHVF